MPSYTATNPTTGQTITLTGDTPPAEADFDQAFAAAAKHAPAASAPVQPQQQIDPQTGTPILTVTNGGSPGEPLGDSTAEQMNNAGHPWNVDELKAAVKDNLAKAAKGTLMGIGAGVGGVAGSSAGPGGTVAGALLGGGIGKKAGELLLGPDQPEAPAVNPASGQGFSANAAALAGNIIPSAIKTADTALGSMSDLSTAAATPGGGEAVLSGVGQSVKDLADPDKWVTNPVGNAATLTMAAEPISGGAKMLAGKAGGLATDALGVSTGTGADVAQSFKAGIRSGEVPSSTAFTDYYTGKKGLEDIAPVFEDALMQLQQSRNDQYRSALSSVTDQTQGTELPGVLADAKRNFAGQVFSPVENNGYGVKVGPQGTLGFSRSSLKGNSAAQGDLQSLYNILQDHGNQPGDTSPMGLHLLKRQLDNFYSDQSAVKSVVTGTKKEITSGLAESFPAYGEMNAKYGQESELISELQRALSMKPGAQKAPALDTALRKIGQLGRENFAFRRSIVQQLESSTGANLLDMTAGYNMGQWLPRGGLGKLIGAGEFAALAHSGVTPAGVAALALSSPKLVGGIMYSLGVPIGMARRIMGRLPEVKAHVESLPIAEQMPAVKYGSMGEEQGVPNPATPTNTGKGGGGVNQFPNAVPNAAYPANTGKLDAPSVGQPLTGGVNNQGLVQPSSAQALTGRVNSQGITQPSSAQQLDMRTGTNLNSPAALHLIPRGY